MRALAVGLALSLVLVLSGCWAAEDDFDCNDLVQLALRDPQTGACITVGSTDSRCHECGNCAPAHFDRMDRAECGGPCAFLGEPSCLEETACRTVYAVSDGSYLGCWGTAPSGAGNGGACDGLDAYQCSRQVNCSAWYVTNGQVATAFDHCGDAPPAASCAWARCDTEEHCIQECASCGAGGASCATECHAACVPDRSCSDLDCILGTTCVERCSGAVRGEAARCSASCEPVAAGAPGFCDGQITCAADPPPCPAGTTPGKGGGCYTGYCVPVSACSGGSPGTCQPGRSSSPAPACPDGTVAGTIASEYTGYCIPLPACGSSPVGTCEPASTTAAPPACPGGTVPGTIDGRYTGACIPADQCPLLPCAALFTEEACAARSECRAVFRGQDCTCTAVSCSCAVRPFERCEAVVGAT